MKYLTLMLLLYQIPFPDSSDPRTWPFGWVLIAVAVILWLIKLLAGTLADIKTIREQGWGAIKNVLIAPRQQAAKERKELKEAVQAVTQTCGDLGPKVDEIRDEVKSTAAWIHHQKETSETPIFILDGKGNMTFANCSFRELVNAEEADLIERKYLSRIEAADRTRFIEELNVAIENKIPFDTVVHFKQDGPHFVAVRLQATADVGRDNLKNFFGSAVAVDLTDKSHHSQI